ncbi:NAD(P)/FAD-dependent oxidoreductase [Streptomyces sp. NPDC087300]|uniref:NAD(P)/FAD-dependent oxidoreductase n=1 Tax=Streptomyces sp. NPDC087300 TaxID=3365780 RepID=UPI00382825F2
MSTKSGQHGLVLGGGFAGILAAHVLAAHMDSVTVVERDVLPSRPEPRKGVPQARHSHLFMGAGARTADALVPGLLDAWTEAGAQLLAAPSDVAFLTKYGWLPRTAHDEFVLCCSRGLLDWVMRDRVLRNERITVLTETEAVGLTGDARRVTGAELRHRTSGERTVLEADFIVAATGRSSRVDDWLAPLGVPRIPVEVVDAGTAYATRLFRPTPEMHRDTPGIVMIANVTGEATGGVLLPLENGLWTATVIGMRGSEPPTSDEEFQDFAKRLSHPAMAELISAATPQGTARGFRGLLNRRLRFEKLPRHPEGLVVLGDAACTLNPSHAHGLTVAASAVAAMRAHLRRHGAVPAVAGRAQRAVSRSAVTAWQLSVNDDLRHPDVVGPRLSPMVRAQNYYADRVMLAATRQPDVTRALLDVIALAAPVTSLMRPRVLTASFRNAGGSPTDSSADPLFQPRGA